MINLLICLGYIRCIAEMSNYSVYTVILFFKGKNNHTEILESAVLLIDTRRKKFNEIQKLIEKNIGNKQ